MNGENVFGVHKITLSDRRQAELTGVDDVLSFDDNLVTLHSSMGDVSVEGEELKIENFSAEKGILTILGKIDSIAYFDDTPRRKRDKKRSGKGL